jgi:hypothetical protein
LKLKTNIFFLINAKGSFKKDRIGLAINENEYRMEEVGKKQVSFSKEFLFVNKDSTKKALNS